MCGRFALTKAMETACHQLGIAVDTLPLFRHSMAGLVQGNPVNMIMIDPTNNNRLFCGADVGVFGAEDAALQVEVIEKVNVEVDQACCQTTQACSNGQLTRKFPFLI
jgi:hypothetical protein